MLFAHLLPELANLAITRVGAVTRSKAKRPAGGPPAALLGWAKASLPVLLCWGTGLDVAAQPNTIAIATATANNQLLQGERLSAWLLRQPLGKDAYLTGLSWRVEREKEAQARHKNALKAHLMGSVLTNRAPPAARQRLSDWINTLPVTGRVRVAIADPRWLEVHPASDPVLAADHKVVVPSRPSTVTVVTSAGLLCPVPHQPGQEAKFYVSACQAQPGPARVDKVWVAQPDGVVQKFGIAAWNGQAQDAPAPGSWIWAPGAQSGWADEFSQLFIDFLATQGPAGGPWPESLLSAAIAPARPERNWPKTRDPSASSSDWGGIGLLQTPTARMAEVGNFSLGFVRNYPYSLLNISIQPLDWAELSYRYTSISNVKYGPATFSGNQSYKDKSIDLKIRLLKESAYLPELAVGARDLVGTGLFSGEYIVANKRFDDFDFSLGAGWGSLGSRGTLGTPLAFVSNKFKTRNAPTGFGGNVGALNFFRGPAALFGGVQWRTPIDSLVLKAEYDGNSFQYPAPFNIAPPKSAFNFGAVYRYSPSIDLTMSLQRGNVAALGVSFHYPMAQLATPKVNDPAPPRFMPQRPAPTAVITWPNTAKDLSALTGWQVAEIYQLGSVMQVQLDNSDAIYWREMTERATAVLHRDAPPQVEEFHFVHYSRGTAMATHVVNRAQWVKSKSQPVLPSDLADQRGEALSLALRPVEPTPLAPTSAPVSLYKATPDKFTSEIGFGFKQSLGGPDGFILYQASVEAYSELKLTPNTWVSSTLNVRAIDNYKKFNYTAPSKLPRVRTFAREFLTTSRVTLPNLQITHAGQLAQNQYFSVYGGLLESMYAGVGGEWLYRPLRGPLALGVDINAVRQRDFDQRFKLRGYSAVTGHATAYIDTGWNDVLAKVSVGQYLAKDKGITVDLSRSFKNGVTYGVYATKTNVSAAQFGEGGFDKGIYIAIPFSAMSARSIPGVGVFTYNPLIRDGGAKLNRAYPLYDLTAVRGRLALETQTSK